MNEKLPETLIITDPPSCTDGSYNGTIWLMFPARVRVKRNARSPQMTLWPMGKKGQRTPSDSC